MHIFKKIRISPKIAILKKTLKPHSAAEVDDDFMDYKESSGSGTMPDSRVKKNKKLMKPVIGKLTTYRF